MFVGIGKIVLSLTTSMQLLVTQRTWLNGLEEKKKTRTHFQHILPCCLIQTKEQEGNIQKQTNKQKTLPVISQSAAKSQTSFIT